MASQPWKWHHNYSSIVCARLPSLNWSEASPNTLKLEQLAKYHSSHTMVYNKLTYQIIQFQQLSNDQQQPVQGIRYISLIIWRTECVISLTRKNVQNHWVHSCMIYLKLCRLTRYNENKKLNKICKSEIRTKILRIEEPLSVLYHTTDLPNWIECDRFGIEWFRAERTAY